MIDFNEDYFGISDVGLVREVNEDRCDAVATPNGYLFVVCDGMGGHVGGATASKIAVKSIVNYLSKERYTMVQHALSDALNYANDEIINEAEKSPSLKGMGTTACVVLVQDDKIWFAHIGDSRIYFYCKHQQLLHHLTKDHSYVQSLVDKGVITPQEAEHHPNKNRILRTLGITPSIQPDICVMPVLPANGDIVLICSDGLSGMVSDDMLEHILRQNNPLSVKGSDMLKMAKQGGGKDNITLQLVQISNSPHKNSIFESRDNQIRENNVRNWKFGNKKNMLIIILAAIIVALSVVMLLTGNKKEVKTEPVQTEIVKKSSFDIAIEGMGHRIYSPNVSGRPVKAIYYKTKVNDEYIGVIDYNDCYYEGRFRFYVDPMDKSSYIIKELETGKTKRK